MRQGNENTLAPQRHGLVSKNAKLPVTITRSVRRIPSGWSWPIEGRRSRAALGAHLR